MTGAKEDFYVTFVTLRRALDDKAEQLMHPPPPFSPSLLIIIYPSPERNGAARAPEPASKRACALESSRMDLEIEGEE